MKKKITKKDRKAFDSALLELYSTGRINREKNANGKWVYFMTAQQKQDYEAEEKL
jgi:hypothetical protein